MATHSREGIARSCAVSALVRAISPLAHLWRREFGCLVPRDNFLRDFDRIDGRRFGRLLPFEQVPAASIEIAASLSAEAATRWLEEAAGETVNVVLRKVMTFARRRPTFRGCFRPACVAFRKRVSAKRRILQDLHRRFDPCAPQL